MIILLCGLGFGLAAAGLVAALLSRPPAFFLSYLAWLERELTFLRSPVSPARFVGLQVFSALASFCVLSCDNSLGWLLLGGSALLPVGLVLARHKRVTRLEAQVEGWLGALGRALEASPSLGEALGVSAEMVDAPLRDEIEQTLSEVHLGLPLDRALSAMGARVRSRTLSLAISTLEVGRETGGELPEVLRKAAAALREMTRLEGVLRTKTAEGRSQAIVIGIVPPAIYLGLPLVEPGFFDPLAAAPTGSVLLVVCVLLWLAAGFISFKILSVQL
jgi:tight adherence protein B